MDRFRKVVAGVRQFSPLLQMAEMGVSPKEMKAAVIEALEPYFCNHDILVELALPALVPEFVNLVRLQTDPWAFSMYEWCLQVHRSAQAVAGEESLRVCASWQNSIDHGLAEFWSAFHLEIPKDNLPLEELKYQIFGNLGMLIEAPFQPHLRELLRQLRLKDHMHPGPVARPDEDAMTLGEVVRELIDTSGHPDFFAPPPQCIALNCWRNIAKHHSSRIEGNAIVCWYGREPRVREIVLTKDELFAVTRRVSDAFIATKLARTVFFVDNIQTTSTLLTDFRIRLEAQILLFASAAATQGFELVDIRLTEEEALAILRDVSDLDPSQRRFHASQFVYPLWTHTGRPRLKVEYQERDGTPNLLTIARAQDCESIARGEIEFYMLANLIQMVDLESEITPLGHDSTSGDQAAR